MRAVRLGIGRPGAGDEWYSPGMTASSDSITVRLFAGLELRTRERRAQLSLTLADAPTVGAISGCLGLEPGVASLVLVNGLHARDDLRLSPGDEVSLFPPLGGG